MTKQDLLLLVKSGAVQSAGILSRNGQFEIWVQTDSAGEEPNVDDVHTTRGELRRWSRLDNAYSFLRECGVRGTIGVDDAPSVVIV